MAPDVWARTGISEHALEFFRVSDAADEGHGRETVEIIARYTPPDRQDEIVVVLDQTMDQLRRMMDGLWKLAQRLEKGVTER